MELTPTKLVVACVALFGGVVALNFLTQYQSDSNFKQSFAGVDFSNLRSRLMKQEGLPEFEGDDEPILRED